LKVHISHSRPLIAAAVVTLLALSSPTAAERRWENGFPDRPDFFPLCVWVQNVRNAERYKAIGINTYVALYRGPTEEQLAALEKAGMYAVVDQNQRSLKFRDSKVIVAWMHGDEPDNAQARRDGQPGWGPPVAPEKIVADYERIKATDPTRPVLLNLGQGAAWDNWHGRGVRSRHPEDYPQYLKGCDIASFDIYPVTHESPEVAGKLWYVGQGVQRLHDWTAGADGAAKPVWACIETTHIHNEKAMPTPQQVRSEVWMAIAHGATGIIYFCHEFKPQQIEAGLLEHPEIVEAVKQVNAEVTRFAPDLNSPTVPDAVELAPTTTPPAVKVLCKRSGRDLLLFAVSRTDTPQRVSLTVRGAAPDAPVQRLDDGRRLALRSGQFDDDFGPYEVHLYRIRADQAAK
jgi:hypothetical protein